MQKKINDTSVCTFDSIKGYENTVHDYMVLSPRGDDKYAIKYVPTDFICNDQGFFEDEKSDYISINEECRKELKRQGFNIDTYRCKW